MTGSGISYWERRRIGAIEGVPPPPIGAREAGDVLAQLGLPPGVSADEVDLEDSRTRRAVAVVWEQATVIQFLENSGMVFDVVFEVLEIVLGLIAEASTGVQAQQAAQDRLGWRSG